MNRFLRVHASPRSTARPTEVNEQPVFGVALDVTDSRRAEREFEEIFNLSLDLILIAGFDGYIKRVNPALETTFGYSTEELRSSSRPADRELVSGATAGGSHRRLGGALSTGHRDYGLLRRQ